jgi:cytochrome c-type biogenesis protein CcmH/NrfG
MLLVDMAWVQCRLHLTGDAIRSARQALQIDPASARAQYLLGSLLAANRSTLAEGVRHLEQAARTMPTAQTALQRAQREMAQTAAHP